MAMEGILDGVRRAIHKWVNTSSRILSNVSVGDTEISIRNAIRFTEGDAVMLKNDTVYETGLYISSVNLVTHVITLTTPALNNWTIAENATLIKTIYEQFIQGIYIGEPDVISRYPAITVNGVSRSSEWFTLESTTERYEIEIGVYVLASTHESGYRFLMNITDEIQKGLKRNIRLLPTEYDVTSLVEDISTGDVDIKLDDISSVLRYPRIYLEDEYEVEEHWVDHVYDTTDDPLQQTIRLHGETCTDWDKDDTSVIIPKRFIYNSWPSNVQYGTIHKGDLLKASKISWFAQEEEMQHKRRDELKLN